MDDREAPVSRRLLISILAALAVVAAAAPLAVTQYRKYEVRKTVSRYDVLLSHALETLQPEVMNEIADQGEVSRIGTHSTYLWGNGLVLESDLLELEVRSVESQGTTITAVVEERWRYLERDRESGKPLGEPTEERQVLTYTLVRRDGRLIVYEAEVEQPEGDGQ